MRGEIGEHRSRIPDAAYLRREARAEYRWNHRGEPDPSEGFPNGKIIPEKGTINFRAEEPTNF